MKIIDCFPFFNEIDLLYYRLSILYDVVDYFVISEATKTHSGINKPLFFMENIEKFEKFSDKIIHVIDDELITPSARTGYSWYNENHQREYIKHGLNKLFLRPEDYIIISDLDEIPDPKVISRIKNDELRIESIAKFEMVFYYYNLISQKTTPWDKAKILRYGILHTQFDGNPDKTRLFDNCYTIRRSGWHLSYFGDEEGIKTKIISFSHQELNNSNFTNLNTIKKHIENSTDLYWRGGGESIKTIAISKNDNLPPEYQKYLQNYLGVKK
jgi:beta-1,4-mannosyl-glycoprotein beta-1,4-N-acetylglucosaminyltransferase